DRRFHAPPPASFGIPSCHGAPCRPQAARSVTSAPTSGEASFFSRITSSAFRIGRDTAAWGRSVNAITEKLRAWREGDGAAFGALVPEVYAELRRIAARLMREQNAAHTLQPTALANEAWLKLAGSEGEWNDRVH